MATEFENLRTGDVVRVANDGETTTEYKWGVLLHDKTFQPLNSRKEGRDYRREWNDDIYASRLARIVKVTPKTITVEITK